MGKRVNTCRYRENFADDACDRLLVFEQSQNVFILVTSFVDCLIVREVVKHHLSGPLKRNEERRSDKSFVFFEHFCV